MSACPCGCGGEVKPGNKFARHGCSQRNLSHRARRKNTKPLEIVGTRVNGEWAAHSKKKTLLGMSWWVGLSREVFQRQLSEELPRMLGSNEGRKTLSIAKLDATGVSVPKKSAPGDTRVELDSCDGDGNEESAA